jgi:hypothetical protein
MKIRSVSDRSAPIAAARPAGRSEASRSRRLHFELHPCSRVVGLIRFGGGLDQQDLVARGHALAGPNADLPHRTGDGRKERRLGLHRLEHSQPLTDADAITRSHRDLDHERRRRGAHLAAEIAMHAVKPAVDLESQLDIGLAEQHRRALVAELQLRGVLPLLEERRLQHLVVQVDAVGPAADRVHLQAVGDAGVDEIHLAAGRRRDLARAPARRIREELQPRRDALALVGQDRSHQQRFDPQLRLRGDARLLEPVRATHAAREVGMVEDVEQEALVHHPAVEHDLQVGDRAHEAGARFLARLAVRDHLRDHRVELRRYFAVRAEARVDADPRARGQLEQRQGTRTRCEAVGGILRADPYLDRVTALGRQRLGEALAARDANLPLHEVDPGEHLRHAVLDLKTRVHLEERRLTVFGDQVLARRDTPVADFEQQTHRSFANLLEHFRGETGRRTFFDDLLVAALHGAVAYSHRERASLPVGDHLHFDVARSAHAGFEEQCAVAEGVRGLRTCTVERSREVRLRLHAADAAAATARCRLDHQRKADALRRRFEVRAFDRAATPR